MIIVISIIIAVLLALFYTWVLRHYRPRGEDKGRGITLLVPFKSDGARRTEIFRWLVRYWAQMLPEAEIRTGTDFSVPFSKTTAVNNAASKASGDIYVIIDADCYMRPEPIIAAAKAIRMARKRGHRLWLIPYRHFYRLTDEASRLVLKSDPGEPFRFSDPPAPWEIENIDSSSFGHWFGALIQIMPREAFELVGGMDERFHGWGGEDVAFMQALDTLYARHKTTDNEVLHLWHPNIGSAWHTRKWEGQDKAGLNDSLAGRYNLCKGSPKRMRQLVDERQPVE